MTAATFVRPSDWTGAPDALVRSETGSRLHIPACPHLGGGIREADPDEVATMQVCSWCRAELDGVGRTYCTDVDDAMRVFGTWAGTEKRIKELLAGVEWDAIWVPNSRSYVALGLRGRGVAWFGKTYVVPAPDEFVELPDYHEVHGGGAPRDERFGELCLTHFVERSVTGRCELCDD